MLAQLIEFVSNHYVLSTLLVVLLILFAFNELNKGGRSLSNRELTSLVNSDQGLVLDIRAKKDFDAGHIVGAVHIPYDKLATRMVELEKHKDKTLIVVTHRTSLLELVDRIIVIDGGRVVADGPKAQVVEALRQGRIGRAG